MKVPEPRIRLKPVAELKSFLSIAAPTRKRILKRKPPIKRAYRIYSDEVRLRVWLMLAEGKMNLSEVARALGIAVPCV